MARKITTKKARERSKIDFTPCGAGLPRLKEQVFTTALQLVTVDLA